MSRIDTPVRTINSFAFPSNSGVSDDASAFEREYQKMLNEIFQSQTMAKIHRQTIRIFKVASKESSSDNWDGYGAKAFDVLAWRKALWFSQLLPTDVPVPDIRVDSDGEATFEWYIAPRQVFSVTVRGNGELVFAGIFGASTTHGTEYLDDELPELVLHNLYKVLG
jgi:hypothetical protein